MTKDLTANSISFREANNRSPVVYGVVLVGLGGARSTLDDGRQFTLSAEEVEALSPIKWKGPSLTKDLADELQRLAEKLDDEPDAARRIYRTAALSLWVENNLFDILSALRGEEWQGIETAAKKHGEIVLLFDGKRVFPGYWGVGAYDRRHKAYNEGWVTGPGETECFPTHWRPLPPPPKGATHE